MIRNSKQVELTKLAYNKGYRANKNGEIIGTRGDKLNLYKDLKGYLMFTIRRPNSCPTRTFVHKLQAYQLFGDDCFKQGFVIRHLNGNKEDNSVNNIQIGTVLDNIMDMTPLQRKLNASSPKHNHSEIINDRLLGMTYKEIQEKYNISSKSTISFIINNSMSKEGLK